MFSTATFLELTSRLFKKNKFLLPAMKQPDLKRKAFLLVIFNYFFFNSDSNLTQTQILTLKLSPNRSLTQSLNQTLILIP